MSEKSKDKVAADAYARDGLVSFGFFHRIIITSHQIRFSSLFSSRLSFYTNIVVVSTLVFCFSRCTVLLRPFPFASLLFYFFFIIIILLCSIGNDTTTTLSFLSRLLVKVSDFWRIDAMVYENAHKLTKDITIHHAEYNKATDEQQSFVVRHSGASRS